MGRAFRPLPAFAGCTTTVTPSPKKPPAVRDLEFTNEKMLGSEHGDDAVEDEDGAATGSNSKDDDNDNGDNGDDDNGGKRPPTIILKTTDDDMPPPPPLHYKTVHEILADWFGEKNSLFASWGGIQNIYDNAKWRKTLNAAAKKRLQQQKYIGTFAKKFNASRAGSSPTAEEFLFSIFHQSRKSATVISLQGVYSALVTNFAKATNKEVSDKDQVPEDNNKGGGREEDMDT